MATLDDLSNTMEAYCSPGDFLRENRLHVPETPSTHKLRHRSTLRHRPATSYFRVTAEKEQTVKAKLEEKNCWRESPEGVIPLEFDIKNRGKGPEYCFCVTFTSKNRFGSSCWFSVADHALSVRIDGIEKQADLNRAFEVLSSDGQPTTPKIFVVPPESQRITKFALSYPSPTTQTEETSLNSSERPVDLTSKFSRLRSAFSRIFK